MDWDVRLVRFLRESMHKTGFTPTLWTPAEVEVHYGGGGVVWLTSSGWKAIANGWMGVAGEWADGWCKSRYENKIRHGKVALKKTWIV